MFATRLGRDFDVWLAALVSLLVSAKFVQMKYPSADSLNSATGNAYNYAAIVEMESRVLNVINWELLQYTVFDFLNFFLAQGCLFTTDLVLSKTGPSQRVT